MQDVPTLVFPLTHSLAFRRLLCFTWRLYLEARKEHLTKWAGSQRLWPALRWGLDLGCRCRSITHRASNNEGLPHGSQKGFTANPGQSPGLPLNVNEFSSFPVGLVYIYIGISILVFTGFFFSPIMSSHEVPATLHVLFHLIFTKWFT